MMRVQKCHFLKGRRRAHSISDGGIKIKKYNTLTMANVLVPYKQDEEKWMQHYLEQAEKQLKPEEIMKEVKNKEIHPNYVTPASQLIAQSQSELKRERRAEKELPVTFAPIKATPEFIASVSHYGHSKGSTSRKRTRTSSKQSNPPKQPKPTKYRKVKVEESGSDDEEFFF